MDLVEAKRLLRGCSLYRLKAEQELYKMSNHDIFYFIMMLSWEMTYKLCVA